jgi:hypothetical protein
MELAQRVPSLVQLARLQVALWDEPNLNGGE